MLHPNLLENCLTAVPATSTLYLPSGLIGLTDLKQFEMIIDDESLPFRRLRSLDSEGVEFVVVEPNGLIPSYTVQIPDEDAEALGVDGSGNPPKILNILTVHSMSPQKVTANLVAPLVVNPQTGTAKQVVLANYKDYSTHFPLIDEA